MQNGQGDPETDLLQEIFVNGELKVDYTFEDIRSRAKVTPEEARALDLEGLLAKFGVN